MKVIVTGATGFIGRPLCRRLAEEGCDVVALTRNKQKGKERLGQNIRVETWDGETASGWKEHADGAYGIVNLAGENIGEGRWSSERKRRIKQSRMYAAAAVKEAVEAADEKPKVLIQASGVGIYGHTGDETVDERSNPGTGFLAELAVEWENASRDVEQSGVRWAAVRTAAVLGENGGALQKMLLPFRMFAGGPLGKGRQYFSWIHLDDEVNAIVHLLKGENTDGPYNLCAPETVTQKQFANALGKVMRRPAFIPTPAFALKGILGQMAEELLLSGQRAEPKRLLESGFNFTYPTIEQALNDIIV